MKTNKEISMNFSGYEITIPKGTRTSNITACGKDENYNFIADLSWVVKEQIGLIHDATYYGILIEPEDVDV